MTKWILIGIFGVVGLIVLVGGVGWFVLSRPIDPDSEMGRSYAEGFKNSFAERCLERMEAATGGVDAATREKVEAACQCGAEASYLEVKDVPVTEQYSRLEEPEMQEKIAAVMTGCIQSAGLQ